MKKMTVQVTPQWGLSRNLGEKTHEVEAFSTFAEMREVAENNPELGEVMVDMINRWTPVVGGGRFFRKELEAKYSMIPGEKTEDFLKRTHGDAKHDYLTKQQLPDILPLLHFIAANARGNGNDKETEMIRTRWNAPDANQAAKRERLKLWGADERLMEADVEEVIAAYKAWKARQKAAGAL